MSRCGSRKGHTEEAIPESQPRVVKVRHTRAGPSEDGRPGGARFSCPVMFLGPDTVLGTQRLLSSVLCTHSRTWGRVFQMRGQ